MKKNRIIRLFLGLALIFNFVACEKESETPEASVVAKFSLTSSNNFIAPSEITFIDESIIPTNAGTATYAWDFGDGSPVSNEKAPKHTYSATGTFTVKLTITSNVKAAEFTLDIIIKSGELFTENFESFNTAGDNLPSSWVVINNDASVPDDSEFFDKAWKVYKSSRFGTGGSNVAAATSWNVDAAVGADDWMILPGINIVNNTFLNWQSMSLTKSGNYLDDYEVYISTTTQDIAGCKATTGKMIKSVTQEQASQIATNPGAGPQTHEVNLSEFNGKKVYIAFRLKTPAPGGDELGIDNIKVYIK